MNGAFVEAVEVWRGERVESMHRAALCAVDQTGKRLLSEGDPSIEVYPRSSLKPVQALPLIETGAADRFGLDPVHLALACASHAGEPEHVEKVEAWLEMLGLNAGHLACGPHFPSRLKAAFDLVKADRAPSRVHNNCSGKHTGMLTVCLHMGFDIEGYEKPDHPLQRMIARHIEALTGRSDLPSPGIDGCSLPNWPLRLDELALAMAKLASGDEKSAGSRILAAMRAHPFLVAGTGRMCTDLMTAAPHIAAKTGAEGVFVACLPGKGQALALKVEDGATRASEVVLMAALGRLGWIETDVLADRQKPVLRNAADLPVGFIQPTGAFSGR